MLHLLHTDRIEVRFRDPMIVAYQNRNVHGELRWLDLHATCVLLQ